MRAHGHAPASAILLIVGAVLCFSILDGIVKLLMQRYAVPMIVWARYAVQALAIMIWLVPTMGWALVRTRKLKLHLIRATLLPISSVCFFSALKYLPLAETTAINYMSPVLVIVLAAIFLHERMTPPRVTLVLAGVAGMLLIVRPGSEVFRGAASLSLASAMAYSVFQILTRKLAREDSRVLLFYPALVGTLLTTAAWPWFGIELEMPWTDVLIIICTGLLGTLGHFAFILALQRAPASALTPYTYIQLVWATLVGWIVFNVFPDLWTLAGMAVIAGSGLLIAMHERRRARGVVIEPAVD